MYVAGIDIGSAATKAIMLDESSIVASHIIRTGPQSKATAEESIKGLLEKSGRSMSDLKYIVATGYGRINVPSANEIITEIACHAKGVNAVFPEARTILDMGGQDCKAIRIDEKGRHVGFAMNDKCAAGTGRFLEIIAQMMKVPLEEIGPLSLEAEEEFKISNVCVVFARSEVARHLRRGVSKATILGGLNQSIADRVHGLLKRVGIEPSFVISGGIGKNVGVVKRIEAKVGLSANISDNPQIIGALGAACFAREKAA